ncbi:MAG: hypothetical protein ACUVWX_02155 [Kiritimatiellia bacterium]
MHQREIMQIIVSGMLTAGLVATAQPLETHTNLQSVTATGTSAWQGSHPFKLRGVILNNPEEMLDSTWDAGAESGGRMGAQWQVFFQAVASGDRGGTACWMGQNYNSIGPWIPPGNFYSEQEWSNEMYRVNHDPTTGHKFRKGDLVEVTARTSLFYGGKRNINESHRTTPSNDFSIVLLQAGYGLPEPEVIRLSDLVLPDDGNPSTREDIFDQSRQSGGECYQGMRVRIEEIQMTTNYFGTNGWGKTAWNDRRCTVTDGQGRYFTLRMPLTDLGLIPSGWFSAVGILNQESGSGSDGTYGYELFVQEIGPSLRIVSSPGKALVYWDGTYTNYVLEFTTDLNGTSGWQRVIAPPRKLIAIEEELDSVGEPVRFYRLRKQD